MMSNTPILAIDVHAHIGRYERAGGGVVNDFMSGDARLVVERARAANVALTIASPLEALLPRGQADAAYGNRLASPIVAATPGLAQYVVIDPRRPETYEQADEMLRQPHCLGIKIHPEEHVYPIQDHGEPIFRFAAERRAVVLSHSSEQNSLASELVALANRFPEMKLILAHIGCGWDGDYTHQVRAMQQSRHGNVYADTSSARSITPGLIEWSVREAGAERILFGTDSPLYLAAMQRTRIDHADLSDSVKRMILRENAERLFQLPFSP